MNRHARIVLVLVLSLASTEVLADGIELQPASGQPLKPVPQSPLYSSLWENSVDASPVIQTSFTQVTPEEETTPPDEAPATEQQTVVPETTDVTQHTTSPELTESPVANAGTPAAAAPFLDLNQEQATAAPMMATGDSETNELFTRLAVWTVIILCLCVLTVLALRRWQRRQGILPSGAGQSRVLETLAIGPGRAVTLVQLGDVRALVGTDGSGINTIVLAPPAFEEELTRFDHQPADTPASDQAA